MVILGGVGNLLGVILGATIIVALPEIFRDLALYRLLVFGLLLMVLMIFRPQGLLPVSRQSTGKVAVLVPPAAADAKEGTAP
jgi:branched-chain amino acid transport system permease protein